MKKYRLELKTKSYGDVRDFIDNQEQQGWELDYFETEKVNDYETEYTAVMKINEED